VRVGLLILAGLLATAPGAEVTVMGSAGSADVSVVRRVDLDYHLVAAGRPLEFEVDGPTWVRAYTRAWWPPGEEGSRAYRLSLWQDEVERGLSFETRRSSSSYADGGKAVGRWRSFYIQVPDGRNSYRLEVDDAPLDTVGVRFSFQRPRPWEGVELDLERRTLVQGETEETFYRLEAGSPSWFSVTGPCRVKVKARLDFVPGMVGAQNFRMSVSEGDRVLAEDNFRVTRSLAATYSGAAGTVPSVERTLRFKLGAGSHRLRAGLSGTLGPSAGFRVERITSEKYE